MGKVQGSCLLSPSLSHVQDTANPCLALEVLSVLTVWEQPHCWARYSNVMGSGPVLLLHPTCPVIAFCLHAQEEEMLETGNLITSIQIFDKSIYANQAALGVAFQLVTYLILRLSLLRGAQ